MMQILRHLGTSWSIQNAIKYMVTRRIGLQVVYTIGAAASAAVAASYAEMAGGGRGGSGGRTPQLSLHLPPELWLLLGATTAVVSLPAASANAS